MSKYKIEGTWLSIGLAITLVGGTYQYHLRAKEKIKSNERIEAMKSGMTPLPEIVEGAWGSHKEYLQSCEEISRINASKDNNTSKIYTGNIVGTEIADKFTIVEDRNGNSLIGLIEVDGKPVLDKDSITYLLKIKEEK
ncbi:hypothetical protein KY321_00355 [Candidatus Woesearchaeota archaeon]|nr:hypothetical protein [Candidatus Woesearchaeota archaeon]